VLSSDNDKASSSLCPGLGSRHSLVGSPAIGSYEEESYIDISQLYEDNVMYIHLKTYIKGIMNFIHLKTRLHPFSFTLGVGTC
jgi:hypothetical protein